MRKTTTEEKKMKIASYKYKEFNNYNKYNKNVSFWIEKLRTPIKKRRG